MEELEKKMKKKELREVLAGAAVNRSGGRIGNTTTQAALVRFAAKLDQVLVRKPRPAAEAAAVAAAEGAAVAAAEGAAEAAAEGAAEATAEAAKAVEACYVVVKTLKQNEHHAANRA